MAADQKLGPAPRGWIEASRWLLARMPRLSAANLSLRCSSYKLESQNNYQFSISHPCISQFRRLWQGLQCVWPQGRRRWSGRRGATRRRTGSARIAWAALGVSLAVGLPTAGPAGAQTLPETMTEANVMAFVDEQGISTVEAFIEALPPLHKQHYVSVFKSDSPSADSISTSHPRIVSWGADARFIVTWTTNPDDPFTESAEFLQPVPEEGRWIAGVIDFSGDSPSLRHPQACASCHGDINKPLWGMFDSWEGTELEHEGSSASEDEAALYETMIASTHPRLAPLERGGYRRTRAKSLEFAGRQLQSPNWEFGQVLALRHAEVLFNRLRAREDYDQVAEFVACADAPPWNGEGLRRRVIAQFSQERYNPRLLSGSLSAIQGINPLVPELLADYSTGQNALLCGRLPRLPRSLAARRRRRRALPPDIERPDLRGRNSNPCQLGRDGALCAGNRDRRKRAARRLPRILRAARAGIH